MNLTKKLKSICNKGAEEAGAILTPSLKTQLLQSNLKHSRNGDVLGHLVESLAIKLQFAQQDRSVLGEINQDEIDALCHEIEEYQSINKNEVKNESF